MRNYKQHKLLSAVALVTCISLAACGDDELTDNDYDDLADSTSALVTSGDGAPDDVDSFKASDDMARGESLLTGSGSGAFRGDLRGFNYEYSVTCTATNGTSLATCNDQTDAASVEVSWSGTFDGQCHDVTASRSGSWTLTQIQTDNVVFNGNGAFNVSSSFEAGAGPVWRKYDLDYKAQYDHVVWQRSTNTVVSGAIHYDVAVEFSRKHGKRIESGSSEVSGTLTFDGSGTATLVLDGMHTYSVDLATGKAQRGISLVHKKPGKKGRGHCSK